MSARGARGGAGHTAAGDNEYVPADYSPRTVALPRPVDYYPKVGVHLRKRNEWRVARCPFCGDRHAILALRVRIDTGAFKCTACGIKGGGIVDFHSLLFDMSRWDARRALSAMSARGAR
jgi:predicted RNA-binding Zn-ribbon protein involved in translation (DUF1610 family)